MTPRPLRKGDRVRVKTGAGFNAVVVRKDGPEPHYYVAADAGVVDYPFRRSELRLLPRRKKGGGR